MSGNSAAITDPLLLPADVILVPVSELPVRVRESIYYDEGDYAISRLRSRNPSKVVDAAAAEFLKLFRSSKTITDAVLEYSRARHCDPEETLDGIFPVLCRLMDACLLVDANSEQAQQIVATLKIGERIGDFDVLDTVQVVQDCEVYRVRGKNGDQAAIKIARTTGGCRIREMLEHEAAILTHLKGCVTPRLLDVGEHRGRAYLALDWCCGIPADMAAAELRGSPGMETRTQLLRLCSTVLESYIQLHARDVIHSDVHPRNVLVSKDGSVKLIDFGLARIEDAADSIGRVRRGGVGFFFEPEYADARRRGRVAPQTSRAGEQYSVAALLYLLFTGAHYAEFSLDKSEMMRQIVEEPVLPFARRNRPPWPDVERTLARALQKVPSERFPGLTEFEAELRRAGVPERETASSVVAGTGPVDPVSTMEFFARVIERVAIDGPLFRTGLTRAPTVSVNLGAAGVAYALYRIARARSDAALLSLADLWCTRATNRVHELNAFYSDEAEITRETVGDVALYHTASGVHCVQALIAEAMGDFVSCQSAINSFLACSRLPCANPDLALGRSGVLLGCAILLDATAANAVDRTQLLARGHELMRELWSELEAEVAISESRQLGFLGIAHGWAGILYATMRLCLSAGAPVPEVVHIGLRQLGACAEPAGKGVRWKRRVIRRGRERGGNYVAG